MVSKKRTSPTDLDSDTPEPGISAKELFARYEEDDERVADAKRTLEAALEARSSTVREIAQVTGKEGLKKWAGRDGSQRMGKIVCRKSGGGGEDDGLPHETWFFKGFGSESVQDYS